MNHARTMFEALTAEINASGKVERPWELFRSQYLADVDEREAALALARWAVENEIAINFETRPDAAGHESPTVLYLILSKRDER